jgi:hypothetical protein
MRPNQPTKNHNYVEQDEIVYGLEEDILTFVDELDAVNYIVAAYLSVDEDIVGHNVDGNLEVNVSIPSEYVDIVERVALLLNVIPLDHWYYHDFTDFDYAILHRALRIAYHDPDEPLYSIYGYTQPPDNLSRSEFTISTVEVLLFLGIDPTLLDRQGRMLHQHVTLTPSEWRRVITVFDYPICYGHISSSPITALIVQIMYGWVQPLPKLVLTRKEYNAALWRDSDRVDAKAIVYVSTYLKRESCYRILDSMANEQLLILTEGMSHFRTQRGILQGLHRYRMRLIAREIDYLPEFGGFLGGLRYQQARDHFLRLSEP